MSISKRAVIFANGILNDPQRVRRLIQPRDLVIAADGGGRLCLQLGIQPGVLIGDFDSLDAQELAALEAAGAEVVRHPQRKDFTDLELALRYAHALGYQEILVLAALGARWDQTLANLLLPAAAELGAAAVRHVDGPQEIMLVRPGEKLQIDGKPGDTVSLIPIAGDAQGVRTQGLEYPLTGETLFFGATRGVSNAMVEKTASLVLEAGLLVCVVIHQ